MFSCFLLSSTAHLRSTICQRDNTTPASHQDSVVFSVNVEKSRSSSVQPFLQNSVQHICKSCDQMQKRKEIAHSQDKSYDESRGKYWDHLCKEVALWHYKLSDSLQCWHAMWELLQAPAVAALPIKLFINASGEIAKLAKWLGPCTYMGNPGEAPGSLF